MKRYSFLLPNRIYRLSSQAYHPISQIHTSKVMSFTFPSTPPKNKSIFFSTGSLFYSPLGSLNARGTVSSCKSLAFRTRPKAPSPRSSETFTSKGGSWRKNMWPSDPFMVGLDDGSVLVAQHRRFNGFWMVISEKQTFIACIIFEHIFPSANHGTHFCLNEMHENTLGIY